MLIAVAGKEGRFIGLHAGDVTSRLPLVLGHLLSNLGHVRRKREHGRYKRRTLILPFHCVSSPSLQASFKPLCTYIMADSKDISTGHAAGTADYYEKGANAEQGRRRSSVADLNRNKNLDAK